MTIDRATTPTTRRQIAVAAIFVAAMSVATATTADAKPKQTPGQQYDQCIVDAVQYRQAHGLDLNMNEIQGGCCAAIGGSVVTQDDGLTFKDCIYPNDPASRTLPPPGATAILPPDSNTRAGTQ